MRQANATRRIAIVGGGLSKCLLPIADESIEKWTLAISCPEALPYSARAFELHDNPVDFDSVNWADIKNLEHRTRAIDAYKQILQNIKCPVYMTKENKELCPSSVRYPFEDVVRRFGGYFDNSVSYMIALAIHEGCDQLLFYGVDFMEERAHFSHAKAACEYYLGIAVGRKIDVLIAPASSLLMPVTGKLYGIDKYVWEIIPEWKEGWEQEQQVRKNLQDVMNGKIKPSELGMSLEPKETQLNRVDPVDITRVRM